MVGLFGVVFFLKKDLRDGTFWCICVTGAFQLLVGFRILRDKFILIIFLNVSFAYAASFRKLNTKMTFSEAHSCFMEGI